jgi:hypothetical protein
VVKFCIIDACMLVNLQREEGLRSTFLRTLLKSQVLCWELQAPLLMNFVLNVPGDVSVCVCVPPVPVFMCNPCGIRFSSLSTLEAHQTYYCSHRAGSTIAAGSTKTSAHKGEDCSTLPLHKTQYCVRVIHKLCSVEWSPENC